MKIFYKDFNLPGEDQRSKKILYIGNEYKYFKKIVESGYDVSNASVVINETSEKIKYELIDYVASVGKKQKKKEIWWMSRIASKFNLKTRFFDRIVFLKAAGQIINNGENINVVVSDAVLFFLIKNNYVNNRIAFSSSIKPFMDLLLWTVSEFLLMLKYRIIFVWEYSRYNRFASQLKKPANKNNVFLYSWLEERSFDENGNFDDIYLPGLYDNKDNNIVLLISYYAGIGTVKKIKSGVEFLSTASFSNLINVLTAAFKFIKFKNYENYSDLNLKLLWITESIEESANYSFTVNYHDYLIYKKIFAEYGGTLLYPFENQPWEKAMLFAAKNVNSKMNFSGYQHSTIGKHQIYYHTTESEIGYMPVPDNIIVNNRENFELMKKMYCRDYVSVYDGGALRYNNSGSQNGGNPNPGESKVGVVLPIDYGQAEELFDNVVKYCGRLEYTFEIKYHPDTKLHTSDALPSNVKIFKGSISDLYAQCEAIVYCSSSCGLEAFGKGIPVFRFQGNFIDLKMGEYSFKPIVINSVSDLTKYEFVKKSPVKVFSDIDKTVWDEVTKF